MDPGPPKKMKMDLDQEDASPSQDVSKLKTFIWG